LEFVVYQRKDGSFDYRRSDFPKDQDETRTVGEPCRSIVAAIAAKNLGNAKAKIKPVIPKEPIQTFLLGAE
jgi:hypothetical protein